ncbi:MAG TPA: methyltransferase domain-containing protein [Candidatus Kapabacteria bacterium]|nr:methyltransferase domain-containing protein [Candidatus Kapabacteria bacterium]
MNRLVNLGCGSRYHPSWINIDIEPTGPGVIAHDLSTGIPLKSGECDAVYHSHVLEHLRRSDARAFLTECARVLKPGGIIRIAVPDLERICRAYLTALESALAGDPGAAANYDWMMLELIDQTTRERSGGEMAAFLRSDPLPNRAFILERIGEEGRRMIDSVRARDAAHGGHGQRPPRRSLRSIARGVRARLTGLVTGRSASRALAIGRFRLGGEVHQWMYDRYSLARLLAECGFVDASVRSATDSLIPGWTGYNLDTLEDGSPVKPDSLYMEAVKE